MRATRPPLEARSLPRRRPSESDSRDLPPSTGVGSLVGNAGTGTVRVLRSPTVVRRSGGTRLGLDESVARAIQQRRGGGASLARGVRERMEGVFGQDFSGVRIHRDAASDQLNESLQARAFTVGSDIFFGRGSPGAASSGGEKLLAHELTHVVEQSGAGGAPTSVSSPADDSERRADIVAEHILTRLGRDKEHDGAARQVDSRGSTQVLTEVSESPASARIGDVGEAPTRRAVVAPAFGSTG